MELELKHLTPYLPYGLKIQGQTHGDIETLSGISQTGVNIEGRSVAAYGWWADLMDIKPLLFPLSSLTKVIEVGGEKFVPDEMFDNEANGKGYHFELQNMARYKYCDGYLPYKVQIKLFEWKIDVNQLIPANLAISVDELPENPYK